MLNIICALAANNAIGFKGRLLFHQRADLKRFKALTSGHTVVMGRKTFDSLPKGALPNRRNIVLTRNARFSAPNVEAFPSLNAALKACDESEEVFIIGGESVYREALAKADRLYLTHLLATPQEADAFFPDMPADEWDCVRSESHEADEQNEVPYTFADYVRKP